MDRARNKIKQSGFKNNLGEEKSSPSVLAKIFLLPLFGGFFMGIANLIPGVSGGTVALIIGIFERLVTALANLSLKNLLNLFKGKFFQKLKYYNFDFLLFLVMGAALSIVLGSKPVSFLLTNYPDPTMVFFSGLIIGSLPIVFNNIQNKSKLVYSMGGFILVMVFKIIENNYQGQGQLNNSFLLALSGALSMCAMILPGISGAFILMLLGQYEKVITAIDKLDLKVLILFGISALVGVILFSRFLKAAFSKHKDMILSFFFGTMVAAALFLPQKILISFVIPSRNLISLLIGFLISLTFSLYEIRKNKKTIPQV